MKKRGMILMALAGMVSAALAQTTLINTGFSTSDVPAFANGDLVGQNNWTEVANTGTNAFNITDAEGSGFLDTVTATFDGDTGSYVYLDTASAGNAVDDQWGGVMDFTLSRTTNDFSGGDLFRIFINH